MYTGPRCRRGNPRCHTNCSPQKASHAERSPLTFGVHGHPWRLRSLEFPVRCRPHAQRETQSARVYATLTMLRAVDCEACFALSLVIDNKLGQHPDCPSFPSRSVQRLSIVSNVETASRRADETPVAGSNAASALCVYIDYVVGSCPALKGEEQGQSIKRETRASRERV